MSTGRKMSNSGKKKRMRSGMGIGVMGIKVDNISIEEYAHKCDMCGFRFKGLMEYGEDVYSVGTLAIPANSKICYSCFAYHDKEHADQFLAGMNPKQAMDWQNPMAHQISPSDQTKILEALKSKGRMTEIIFDKMKKGEQHGLQKSINQFIDEFMNTKYHEVLKTLDMPDDLKNTALEKNTREMIHEVLDESEYQVLALDVLGKLLNKSNLNEKEYEEKSEHYIGLIDHFENCTDCFCPDKDGRKLTIKELSTPDKLLIVKYRVHVDEKHKNKDCEICNYDYTVEQKKEIEPKPLEQIASPYSIVKKPIVKLTYLEVVAKLKALRITTRNQFNRAIKKGILKGVEKDPTKYPEWSSWQEFLAIRVERKSKGITLDKIENAIKMLSQHWEFYMRQPDGFFYDWFDSWGLFKTKDQWKSLFFNSFIQLKQTPEGRKQLYEAISKGRFSMTDGNYPAGVPSKTATPRPIANFKIMSFKKEQLILLEDEELGVHKILKEAEQLIPMDVNSRAFKLHVNIILRSLWKVMFDPKKEQKEMSKIKGMRKGTSVLYKAVLQRFMDEHKAIQNMWSKIITSDYRGKPPNMMQLYVAYMVKHKNGFCNFSRTGGGKTLSAILASRVSACRRTVVMCPLSIVDQWDNDIIEAYPLSKVSKGDKIIFPDVQKSKLDYRYHVINYDKFQYDDKAKKIIDLMAKDKVDMVILDEVQNVKQRYDPKKPEELYEREQAECMSHRRKNTQLMLDILRSKNPNLKVVMLTATPVINNLTEGIKLLEMVANKEFPHLRSPNKIRNASRLYTEFIEYSIRHYKKYDIKETEETIISHTKIPNHVPDPEVRQWNYSDWEILCTKDRIPHIIKILKQSNGKAIIYTEYVTKIVDALHDAIVSETNPITNMPYRVGFFTGDDKHGLRKPTQIKGEYTNPFINGDIDILIASTPIAEGIDGLQKVCNTMIFNGLPWTYAKFEQIIGRLVRTGQVQKSVTFYPILTEIEGYNYDLKIKRDRLYRKELMQMCVLDGQIPDIEGFRKKSQKTFHDFVNTVLINRESRLPTNSELRIKIRNRGDQNE